MSFGTKSHEMNIPPLPKPLLVTTIKICTYRERNVLLSRLKNTFISQCTSLKKENIQKSGCQPLVKLKAFGLSSCLFFTPNQAEACYEDTVSVHSPPNYNFFTDRKNFPAEITMKEKNTSFF